MNDYENTELYSKIFQYMRPDFRILWSVLEVIQPEVLAELGCGNGRLLPLWLASGAHTIIGLDIEERMLREFAAVASPRVHTAMADLREPSATMRTADLTVLTGSLLKHLDRRERKRAMAALHRSLAQHAFVFIDQSSYLYGISSSTSWQSFFDTFRCWWPEQRWNDLKRLSWRKEVNGDADILYYRDDDTGNIAHVKTYVYPIEELQQDIRSAGMHYATISMDLPAPVHIAGMERFSALLSHPAIPSRDLESLATRVRDLAFKEFSLKRSDA